MKQACLLALLLSLSFSRAESRQRAVPLSPRPASVGPQSQRSSSAPVRVLALLVEFQSDLDDETSGDGRFLLTGSPDQIDPPPHDTSYFSSKLRFLENYFARVSNGQVVIQGELFPQIVSLADTMAAYSPMGESNKPLADLIIDSWSAANAADPLFPFSQFGAFIIFHAGVGRDVDLVSLLGFDPFPHDIPSVTVNLPTLREYLDDPGYSGVPVNNGSFLITNSMILPETETRVFTSGSQTDTLQLSINGLLAASFGSVLGLPDLFDTKTGRPGIGQFGLMDGASIFAYSGLFPPEPSAWEKIHLGWTSPITIATGTTDLTIPAVGLTQSGGDTVYKIPISSTEYFLIENRHRDPEGDGQTLTIVQQGQTIVRHFSADTAGFSFFDVGGIAGSVVDVQNPDWAVPGSTLDEGFEGGGILIWHIDESNLPERLASNTLNADPDNRTVDLEEADGSQDIGQSYEFLEPGSGTEGGWPLDFWFEGNQVPVYRNLFDSSTFPDSKANSGTVSLISIGGFGPTSPRMTATVRQGNDLFARTFRSPRIPGGGLVRITATDSGLFYENSEGIAALRPDGSSRTNDPSGVISAQRSDRPLAVLEGNPAHVITGRDSSVIIWQLTDSTADGRFDLLASSELNVGGRISAGPVLIDSAATTFIVVGTDGGEVVSLRLDGTVSSIESADTTRIRSILWFPPDASAPSGKLVSLTQNGIARVPGPRASTGPDTDVLSGARFNGNDYLFVNDPRFGISTFDLQLSRTRSLSLGDIVPPGETYSPFSALVPTDLDNDNHLDVIAFSGRKIMAFNEEGIMLDGFPAVYGPAPWSKLLLADFAGDSRVEILALADDGTLHAFGSTGETLPGFPIHVTDAQTSPVLFRTLSGNVGIAIPSKDGFVDGWELNSPLTHVQGEWLQESSNPGRTGVSIINTAGTQPISPLFLPSERVYNWPNPVYGTTTRIRYYTSAAADISIKILTLAGELVTELKGTSSGGIDGEIPWDVSNIGSGIYLARVEATGAGTNESVVIKIAVVK